MKSLHLLISGMVQGVFFRANLKKEAENFGCVGWVKNLEDGRVEALIQGKEAMVDKVLAWCRRGPKNAKVEKIEIKTYESLEKFTSFSLKF